MAEEKQKDQQAEQLVDLGAATTNTSRGSIYTLTIVGQIEGHQALPENVKTTKYEHVLPLLASVEESEEIDGLLILLNTVGGDIEAGLAIAELDRRDEEADGVAGARRRTFDRDSTGRIGAAEHDRPDGVDDGASSAHDGTRRRRAADLSVF